MPLLNSLCPSVTVIMAVICLSCGESCLGAALPPHWSYDRNGTDGPASWPSLYKRWCSGRKQSPINIESATAVYDESLSQYSVSELPNPASLRYRLVNDGHKVLVNFGNAQINVSLNRHQRECFRPHHVHWHWGGLDNIGSEHQLSGRQYPMEGHIVMWDCRFWDSFEAAALGIDGLAVLGFFYELDDATGSSGPLPVLTAQFNQTGVSHCDLCANESYSNPGIEVAGFSVRDLLPADMSRYFVYYGSLTTPDCRENVLWTVFTDTVKISRTVMNRFRSLQMPADRSGARARMVNNFRGPVPLNPTDPVGARRQLSRSFAVIPPTASGIKQACSGSWVIVASAACCLLSKALAYSA